MDLVGLELAIDLQYDDKVVTSDRAFTKSDEGVTDKKGGVNTKTIFVLYFLANCCLSQRFQVPRGTED